MALRDSLSIEFEQEARRTEQILAACAHLPLEWRPHDRSRTLGELVSHVAEVPAWSARILGALAFDIAALPPSSRTGPLSAHLETFAEHAATTRRLIDKSDAEWHAVWCLRRNDEELFAMPRAAAFRRLVLNHLIHHRGQLAVYVRVLGGIVPPIYGDSADSPLLP